MLPQPTNQALVKIDNRSAGKRTVQALRLPAYIVEHSQIAEVLHRLLQRCGTRAFQIAKFFFEQAGIATDVAADLASQRGFESDRWKRADINKPGRSEEHTSELQSLMRTSYAVFCLKKKNQSTTNPKYQNEYAT